VRENLKSATKKTFSSFFSLLFVCLFLLYFTLLWITN